MSIKITNITEGKSHRQSILPAALAGGAVGSVARYVIPTKAEMGSFFNKENFDTFVSSAATKTRGANRSILAYAAIGAVLSAGIAKIVKSFKGNNDTVIENKEYDKFDAIIDASPDAYACTVLWY